MAQSNLLTCRFCGKDSEIEEIAGKLHAEETDSGKLITAHHRCMQYASALTQYKTDEFGGFDVDEVEKEIKRGQKLRCSLCKLSQPKNSKGACCGCAVRSCRKTFHYPCAVTDPDTITKRLVVTTNKNTDSKEKFVYYRVFCSKEHEVAFRETLREELRDSKTKRQKRTRDSTEHEDEASQDEEEEMGEILDSSAAAEHNTSAVSEFRSLPRNQVSSSNYDDSAYLSPADMESKHISPGERLLLSFANNLSRTEPGEPITRSPAKRRVERTPVKSPSPWQVLAVPENQSCAVNATVIVHENANHRGHEQEAQSVPDLNVNDADSCEDLPSTFLNARRSTRNSSKFTGPQGVLPEDITVVISDSTPERSLRRSPRKTLDQNNIATARISDNDGGESVRSLADSITPQPSPRIPSLNSTHTTRQMRQKAVREPVQQNGIGGDVASDSVSEMDSSHESLQSSIRSTRSRKTDVTNDVQAIDLNASHSSGLLEKSSSEQPDAREVPKSNSLLDTGRQSRKRKMEDGDDSRSVLALASKSSRTTESTAPSSLASVLLIPSSMGEFKRLERQVMEMAVDTLKVKATNICVWQMIVRKSLPSDLLVFFLLELVKELKNDNSETLLNLLFDEEYVAARENTYVAQAKVLHSMNDEKSQKDVQQAIWGGLERNVKDLPMVRTLHLPHHDLTTLAIDVHLCHDSTRVQAYLQAHKGLSWWDEGTDLASLNLHPGARSLAAQAEVWTWQVWLTKVCPVAEVSILPADHYAHHADRKAASPELQTLLQTLKDTTNPRTGNGLLLIFQHADTKVVNFPQYFRKVCLSVLQSKPSGSVLALVPLDNLHNKSFDSVSGLMSDGSIKRKAVQYCVSVRTAFSVRHHLTQLVLLEITTAAPQ
ncbi:hypothetical protein ACOMHN_047029 [Nucella lapillus]